MNTNIHQEFLVCMSFEHNNLDSSGLLFGLGVLELCNDFELLVECNLSLSGFELDNILLYDKKT